MLDLAETLAEQATVTEATEMASVVRGMEALDPEQRCDIDLKSLLPNATGKAMKGDAGKGGGKASTMCTSAALALFHGLQNATFVNVSSSSTRPRDIGKQPCNRFQPHPLKRMWSVGRHVCTCATGLRDVFHRRHGRHLVNLQDLERLSKFPIHIQAQLRSFRVNAQLRQSLVAGELHTWHNMYILAW